jgi:Tol biopolymer transport system component
MRNGRDLMMPVASTYETDDRMQLREISSLTGRTRNLTNDIYGYKSISLTPDDNNLLAVRADVRTHFWIAEGPQPTNGRSLSGDSGRYDSIGWTDRKKLIAQANRGTGIGIWLIDPSNGHKTMLTDPQTTARDPGWLHGHDSVLFVSDRDGTSSLWRLSTGTGASHLLVQGQDYIESPDSSPDGNAVFYTSWKWDECSIWTIPATGSTRSLKPELLINGARNGVVSPDGKLVALELAKERRAGERTTWRTGVFDLNSRTIVREIPEVRSGSKLRWFPDGSGLTYVVTDDQDTSNIWFQPLSGGHPKVLTTFQEERVFDYNWSADGADFACLRGRKWSDAFLFRRKKSWIGKLFAQH